MPTREIPTVYDPKAVEEWYKWLENGYFTPRIDKRKNLLLLLSLTECHRALHMGHALTTPFRCVDPFSPYGGDTLWLPGTTTPVSPPRLG